MLYEVITHPVLQFGIVGENRSGQAEQRMIDLRQGVIVVPDDHHRQDRTKALDHLDKCIKTDAIDGFHWWAVGIRGLLRSEHELLDRLR